MLANLSPGLVEANLTMVMANPMNPMMMMANSTLNIFPPPLLRHKIRIRSTILKPCNDFAFVTYYKLAVNFTPFGLCVQGWRRANLLKKKRSSNCEFYKTKDPDQDNASSSSSLESLPL
jgi:hypothetical protein